MDPSLKLILDELKGVVTSVTDLKTSLAERIDGVEKALGDHFQSVEQAAQQLEDWKPKVEASVEDLRVEIGALRKTVNRVVLDSSPSPAPGIFAKPPASAVNPSSSFKGEGQEDNSAVNSSGKGLGTVFTHTHLPLKGMNTGSAPRIQRSASHTDLHSEDVRSQFQEELRGSRSLPSNSKIPKVHFPVFSGDNPRLWIKRSEDYFELYSLNSSVWIKFATMQFEGVAARWLQSVEKHLSQISWSEFCKLLLEHFGKDQHEVLLRQLFRIRQTSSVKEYIEQFTGLVDQLSAYGGSSDPLLYTMKFLEGLKEEIRSVISVQRPQDLDAACVMAQLQKDVGDPYKKKDFRRSDYSLTSKSFSGSPLPLPVPPRAEKPSGYAQAHDRRGTEAARLKPVEDKLSALCAYRRARGLCVKCAEKWSRDHRCPETIQLNVLQEVWELLQLEEDSTDSVFQAGNEADDTQLMALSVAAVTGKNAPKTLRLLGQIQHKDVLILVDSGSSHTFISSKMAGQLQGSKPMESSLLVTVADGSRLQCTSHFEQLQWSTQGCKFSSEARLLSLEHYDMIVGMDWLESHSPMKIHWKQKWLAIPYQGSTALIQGISPDVPEGTIVEICAVLLVDDKAIQLDVPPELSNLLEEFAEVFSKPVGMPPSRDCDHTIPLIEGASPVNVRPYRYPPAIKDEIEKQVAEMLRAGIIQHSISPFSSSVLLVKKKDQTWRFCVDFRHLNAITLKGKYPVPVIEEFLDELAGASWFTSLDLTAGYHQVRLKAGEEYKTAFQTHSGHYEFRVMAFGLSGGLDTFQKAMNTTLHPLLRKCVLVFFDDILIYSKTFEEHLVHIKLVLQLLSRDQWKVKLSKCTFAQRQVAYLGHVISQQGVATDPSKVMAVANWPTPTSVKANPRVYG
ncbi:unnamed protein product [Urochloa humidicola]